MCTCILSPCPPAPPAVLLSASPPPPHSRSGCPHLSAPERGPPPQEQCQSCHGSGDQPASALHSAVCVCVCVCVYMYMYMYNVCEALCSFVTTCSSRSGCCAFWFVNPRRACAVRVTVLVLCVCLSVCESARYSGGTRNHK